jgi:hypothetical protein
VQYRSFDGSASFRPLGPDKARVRSEGAAVLISSTRVTNLSTTATAVPAANGERVAWKIQNQTATAMRCGLKDFEGAGDYSTVLKAESTAGAGDGGIYASSGPDVWTGAVYCECASGTCTGAPIDLSAPEDSASYATATVRVLGKSPGDSLTMRGQPIVYAFTVPTGAPHPTLALRFARYLLSAEGRRVLRRAKLDALDAPILVGSAPNALQG